MSTARSIRSRITSRCSKPRNHSGTAESKQAADVHLEAENEASFKCQAFRCCRAGLRIGGVHRGTDTEPRLRRLKARQRGSVPFFLVRNRNRRPACPTPCFDRRGQEPDSPGFEASISVMAGAENADALNHGAPTRSCIMRMTVRLFQLAIHNLRTRTINPDSCRTRTTSIAFRGASCVPLARGSCARWLPKRFDNALALLGREHGSLRRHPMPMHVFVCFRAITVTV